MVLFSMGFRPFFLMALGFAVASMLVWSWNWQADVPIPTIFTPAIWHAHEMIFGYGSCILAGFLLTAVRNWTGLPTPQGIHLALLALIWLTARLATFGPGVVSFYLSATGSVLFTLLLFASIARPIIQSKSYRNLGIATIILAFGACDLVFYISAAVGLDWLGKSMYLGFYLLILLITIMLGRLFPFFMQNGMGFPHQVKSPAWLDRVIIAFFLPYVLLDVFFASSPWSNTMAGLLALACLLRLVYWHHEDLWFKPLLWVLYVAQGWLALGFFMDFLVLLFPVSPLLTLHALAIGGLATVSAGIMARVVIGHTGRDMHNPPKSLAVIFMLLTLCAVMRAIMPLIYIKAYEIWIPASQVLWLSAFAIMFMVYLPMLCNKRVDGKPG